MSIQALREYIADLWVQYQDAGRKLKSTILDEITRNMDCHRKSAIRLMGDAEPPKLGRGKGNRKAHYTEAAVQLLKLLWREMGYLGSVRMKAALPDWMPYFENPDYDEKTKKQVLKMSAKTMDRKLLAEKAALRRRLNTGTKKSKSRIVTLIPLRDLDFSPDEPGHCEVDLVAHCGSSMSGKFAWTVTLTDIKTGHTECEAIWGKNGYIVMLALRKIEARLPFPLIAIYFDNGSEFLNDDIFKRFANHPDRDRKIELYRGRPRRKNDQCYVEQKNYTHVRQLFGYERLDWKLAVQLMNNLYRKEWSLLQNHFYPQSKLIEKVRVGSKIKRRMDKPLTPYKRLMSWADSSGQGFPDLELEHDSLNPFKLRSAQKKKLRDFRKYQGREKKHTSKYAL